MIRKVTTILQEKEGIDERLQRANKMNRSARNMCKSYTKMTESKVKLKELQ